MEMTSLQVSSGHVVPLDEGTLLVDDLIDTKVRVEVGLDVREDGDRPVRASATARIVSTRSCTFTEADVKGQTRTGPGR